MTIFDELRKKIWENRKHDPSRILAGIRDTSLVIDRGLQNLAWQISEAPNANVADCLDFVNWLEQIKPCPKCETSGVIQTGYAKGFFCGCEYGQKLEKATGDKSHILTAHAPDCTCFKCCIGDDAYLWLKNPSEY